MLYPDVVVDLRGQESKPVACVALVRRTLQKAGHGDAASRFTDEVFAEPTERIFEIAQKYVRVLSRETSLQGDSSSE